MVRKARGGAVLVAAVSVIAGACGGGDDRAQAAAQSMDDVVEYTVVLKSTWTAANHPFE